MSRGDKEAPAPGARGLWFGLTAWGFRPKRSAHHALKEVRKHLLEDKINYVFEADIRALLAAIRETVDEMGIRLQPVTD